MKPHHRFIWLSRRWLERYIENWQVSIPFVGGPAATIKRSEISKIIPTRTGINSIDKKSPFVESRFKQLYDFYYGYLNSKPYHSFATYTDITLLNQAGVGFKTGMDVSELSIVVQKESYDLPTRLQRHRIEGVNLFRALGKVRRNRKSKVGYQDDLSARIVEFSPPSKTIHIQPANYFDQVATNLTMDWASGVIADNPMATTRNDIEPASKGFLVPLRDSILANTLGVATFVLTADEDILIPIRGQNLAIMNQGQFHCSSSGVFTWEPSDYDDKQADFNLFYQAIQSEIKRELNLDTDEYSIAPLAFARELARGGKPQLFFFAKSKLNLQQITQKIATAEEQWEFIQPGELSPESPLLPWINHPESIEPNLNTVESCFTYEGWMGLRLVKSYLTGKAAFQ